MNTLLTGLCIWISIIWGTSFVKCDCIINAKDGSKSQFHISRLDPIKGKTFEFTYTESAEGGDAYQYKFALCSELSKGTHAGLTQQRADSESEKKPVVIGRVNDTAIKSGTDWIMLTYRSGQAYHNHCNGAQRQAHIMIMCNKDMVAGNFAVLYEENKSDSSDCFYLLEMESSVACSNINQGLSTGSIILIIFACLLFTYLAVGMTYKRCVHGSKGVEQVPNITFWRMCGNLQADGCEWLCRCQDSGFDSSRPYHGIADDQLDEDADDEHLLPM